MSKVTLLDFEEKDLALLGGGNHEVELMSTRWETEDSESVAGVGDSDVVFCQLNGEGTAEEIDSGTGPDFPSLVEKGGVVVCFVGNADASRLTGFIGSVPDMAYLDSPSFPSIRLNQSGPFRPLLEKFQPSISQARKLFPEPLPEAAWLMDSSFGRFEILAKSADGCPVSVLVRKGRGFFVLLPWFGEKNIEVAGYVLTDVLPRMDSWAAEDKDSRWLEKEEYCFPVLKELVLKREEEGRRHEEALRALDEQIRDIKAVEQESFHKLLKAEGPELKKAVLNALAYLGWEKVVDVDAYWKNVIRNKEEHIWLIEGESSSIEAGMRNDYFILVVVCGNKNWAADDECALLQKYKGRRMQEFGNTGMKALLIGNYFSATEARLRNQPFTSVQIDEAEKDGNGLLTTWELFRAIKAEKENRISKEEIRRRIKEKTGLIQFDV